MVTVVTDQKEIFFYVTDATKAPVGGDGIIFYLLVAGQEKIIHKMAENIIINTHVIITNSKNLIRNISFEQV